MRIFDFKSIEANKRGQKSETQIKKIKEAVQPGLWLYGGLGILVFGGCFFAFFSSAGSGAAGAFGWVIAAVGLFAALRGSTTWNLRRKLLAEPIQSAEGTVVFKMAEGAAQLIDADRYIAQTIEGKKLNPIGLAGVSAPLPPGDYRFFYLNTRNWLLEAEPLSTEEELRDNLNEVLANVFGYDKAQLEDFRRQAREGRLKTAEGLLKMDTSQSIATVDAPSITEYFCKLGDFEFQLSGRAGIALIANIPYRVYYGAEENSAIFAVEVA